MSNAIIIPPLPIAAVTASSTAAGRQAAYAANDFAGVAWQSNAETLVNLTVDLGSDLQSDTVMMFGCGPDTDLVTLKVYAATAAQGSTFASSSWSSSTQDFAAGSSKPVSGLQTALMHVPTGGPPAARYYLLQINGLLGRTFQVSRIVLGKSIRLERNFAVGASFGVRDLGSLDFSRRGVLQRSRGKKLRTAGLTFSNIYKDELEAQTKPLLERIGNTEMIGLVTDPSADPQRQNRCYYGPLVGDLGHAMRKASLYEAKVNVVSIF